MKKHLYFNTTTGELEYLGYSISVEHGIGYEADYSYSYVEYTASKIDGKDFEIVDENLDELLKTIEIRIEVNKEQI